MVNTCFTVIKCIISVSFIKWFIFLLFYFFRIKITILHSSDIQDSNPFLENIIWAVTFIGGKQTDVPEENRQYAIPPTFTMRSYHDSPQYVEPGGYVERIIYTTNRTLALNITQLSYQWYCSKHCHTRVHTIDHFRMPWSIKK